MQSIPRPLPDGSIQRQCFAYGEDRAGFNTYQISGDQGPKVVGQTLYLTRHPLRHEWQ